MQNIIKSWFKYFIFVGFFAGCVNLIYLAIPVYMMIVYDRVLFSFSTATLYTLSVGVLISLAMMGLIDYFRMRMLGQAGNSLAQKMMPFVIKSMQADAAGISSQGYVRGLYDLEQVRDAIVHGHVFYILDLPWVIVYLGLLYVMHPLVGVVAIAGVFMAALFHMLLKRLEKRRYVIADVAFQDNTGFAAACLQHAGLVSGMGMVPSVMERYTDRYKKVLASKSEADAFHSGVGSLIRLLHLTVLAAVFGAGAFVFFADEMTVGVIFASVMIIARVFCPFERSLAGMKASIDAMAAYKRLAHFVDTRDHKNKLSLPRPEGKFDAEAVSLAVDGKTILHNISFSLEPGETLGVSGPSSAGKTSLCRVLLGIWPAVAGKVRLDGAQIAQWPREDFGKYVGYLPEEPALFPASVAQNISRLEEVVSEKVVKAAQKAGIHEMILKLPQGYDTQIDQTGKNLAAGQRQLISLARALYGDPKFVVLDEPHTHLDESGLRRVFNTLKNLKHEKITAIVVTDRPAFLVNMDKILVIKEGQVAMYGPAKEVLGKLANRQQPQQVAGV